MHFSDITTIAVGGEIADYIQAKSPEELLNSLRSHPEAIIVGDGSNLLPRDGEYSGVVIQTCANRLGNVMPDENDLQAEDAKFTWIGSPLDEVAELMNFAALSGIPGTLGGAIVQNAGAYGDEICNYVEVVQVLDRAKNEVIEISRAECEFGYRSSIFKRNPRFVVLAVKLFRKSTIQKVHHLQLAKALGCENGAEKPAAEIRSAVLKIRAKKGMLAPGFVVVDSRAASSFMDPSDPDRRSVGSFFTNPIVSAELTDQLMEKFPEMPHFLVSAASDDCAPSSDSANECGGRNSQRVKLSAAWLIDHLIEHGEMEIPPELYPARLSSKHCLAIVNSEPGHPEAGAKIRELSILIKNAVRAKFGVELEPEPVML